MWEREREKKIEKIRLGKKVAEKQKKDWKQEEKYAIMYYRKYNESEKYKVYKNFKQKV